MKPVAPGREGWLREIFLSLQGEGPWAGNLEVFLRLAGCSLECPWCDTREAWVRSGELLLPGGEKEANPISPGRAAELVLSTASGKTRWVSLTGGEPLEQPGFLEGLLPGLQGRGFSVHLETAGVHPAPLELLLPGLDRVSMDWKLPSLLGRDLGERHRAFLSILDAWEGEKCVKIVVGGSSPLEEIDRALEGLESLCPSARAVLQPLTPPGGRLPEREALERCLAAAERWSGRIGDLRILPQLHRILGLP